MMKILGGELRGRQFAAPKTSATRPLSDKVRAAIFDVLGDVDGMIILDAYAGSGAAGFEALSRGASMVEAIEAASAATRVIESNTKTLKIGWGYLVHALKVETWLALPGNQSYLGRTLQRYNVIIADPPYARIDTDILQRLAQFLIANGVLVVSHSSKTPSPVLESMELVQSKTYGDTALSFYRRQ